MFEMFVIVSKYTVTGLKRWSIGCSPSPFYLGFQLLHLAPVLDVTIPAEFTVVGQIIVENDERMTLERNDLKFGYIRIIIVVVIVAVVSSTISIITLGILRRGWLSLPLRVSLEANREVLLGNTWNKENRRQINIVSSTQSLTTNVKVSLRTSAMIQCK